MVIRSLDMFSKVSTGGLQAYEELFPAFLKVIKGRGYKGKV